MIILIPTPILLLLVLEAQALQVLQHGPTPRLIHIVVVPLLLLQRTIVHIAAGFAGLCSAGFVCMFHYRFAAYNPCSLVQPYRTQHISDELRDVHFIMLAGTRVRKRCERPCWRVQYEHHVGIHWPYGRGPSTNCL